jgi:hypothetical protein
VLGGPVRMSSLLVSVSSIMELIEDSVDPGVAIGVHWGTRSALAVAMSHFPELEIELDLFGSRHKTDPTEDQVDALWTQTRQALESLAALIPPSVAHGSPDDMGEE